MISIDPGTLLILQMVGGLSSALVLAGSLFSERQRSVYLALLVTGFLVAGSFLVLLRVIAPLWVSSLLSSASYLIAVGVMHGACTLHDRDEVDRRPFVLVAVGVWVVVLGLVLGWDYTVRAVVLATVLCLLLAWSIHALVRDAGLGRERARWFLVGLLGLTLFAMAARVPVLLLSAAVDGDILAPGLEQSLALLPAVLMSVGIGPGFLLMLHERTVKQAMALATVDPLTGCLNRRALLARVEVALVDAARRGESVALLVLDLDHFKKVNDTHGHAAGDVVLRELAGRIGSCIRPADHFARIGGEEFCILLPRTARHGALVVAGRIREVVSAAPVGLPAGGEVAVTVSVGAAVLSEDADGCGPAQQSWDRLFQRADRALMEAKATGRDRVNLAAGGPERAPSGSVPRPRVSAPDGSTDG